MFALSWTVVELVFIWSTRYDPAPLECEFIVSEARGGGRSWYFVCLQESLQKAFDIRWTTYLLCQRRILRGIPPKPTWRMDPSSELLAQHNPLLRDRRRLIYWNVYFGTCFFSVPGMGLEIREKSRALVVGGCGIWDYNLGGRAWGGYNPL